MRMKLRGFSLLLVVLILASCGTQKKIRKAKEIAAKYPSEFASFCALYFPIVPTYILGKDSIIERTITVKGDSIPCPAKVGEIPVYVKCPDAKVVYRDILRVDTVIQESTAKLDNARAKISSLQLLLKKEQEDKAKYKESASNRLYLIIALFILLGGAIYWIIRR